MVDNEQKLGMSLDEIIAKNRVTRKVKAKPATKAVRAAGADAGAGGRGRGRGSRGRKSPPQNFTISVKNTAPVAKKTGTPGRGGAARKSSRRAGGGSGGGMPRDARPSPLDRSAPPGFERGGGAFGGMSAKGLAAARALGKVPRDMGAALADPTPAARQARAQRAASLASGAGGVWKHDLFQDHDQTARRNRGGAAAPMAAAAMAAPVAEVDPSKLCVSNLHYDVTNEDMHELFSRIGPLRSATLLYGEDGRSEGCAEVVFHNAKDAAQARQEYNGVQLDGLKMQIEFYTPPAPADRFANRLRGGSAGGRARGRGASGTMRMDMS